MKVKMFPSFCIGYLADYSEWTLTIVLLHHPVNEKEYSSEMCESARGDLSH